MNKNISKWITSVILLVYVVGYTQSPELDALAYSQNSESDYNGNVDVFANLLNTVARYVDEATGLVGYKGEVFGGGIVDIPAVYAFGYDFSGGWALVYKVEADQLVAKYINNGGKELIIKNNGSVVTQKIVRARSFWNDRAIVMFDKDPMYSIIDGSGNIIIKNKYKAIRNYNHRWAAADAGDPNDKYLHSWCFLDLNGNRINKENFYDVKSFSAALLAPAKVRVKGKGFRTMWGYIDTTGQFKIKPQFDEANRFLHNGSATAVNTLTEKQKEARDANFIASYFSTKPQYGFINAKGEYKIEPTIYTEVIGDFFNEFAMVQRTDGEVHIINLAGKSTDNVSNKICCPTVITRVYYYALSGPQRAFEIRDTLYTISETGKLEKIDGLELLTINSIKLWEKREKTFKSEYGLPTD